VCGIAGFVGRGDAAVLAAMAASIAHRGPDGAGSLIDETARVFLAHRRLAILDPTRGAQPLGNEDGSVVVVFNGEIYNHHELRRTLIERGHRFVTDHCDTEVLVHGWEEWGEDLPGRLDGMFAFALWDRRRHLLFLARDRFGKKPLYYAAGRDSFVFGSELTALMRHPAVEDTADRLALKKLFAYGFIPAPLTRYRAVRKLPGGHWLRYDLGDGGLEQREYWRFRLAPDPALARRGLDDLADELRALFSDAVARRLESDVPLGALLSGGVDSSAVVWAMAQHLPPERIETFAMGFDEPSFDESAYAQTMAEAVGSRHHRDLCRLEEARDGLVPLLSRLDEPIADSSVLPTWRVCRFAAGRVKVALTGDGGDELFAGYDPFLALAPTRAWRAVVPGAVSGWCAGLAGHLPRSDANMSLDFKIRRWLGGVRAAPACWIPTWMAPLALDEIARLFGEPAPAEEVYAEALAAWDEAGADHPVDRALEYFTRLYLQDDILVKSDRASMLNGLELRSPFLDAAVVDFAARLPRRFKLHRGERKRLLKRAFAGRVPDSLLRRRKKGFGMPIGAWLRRLAPPPAGRLPDLDESWLAARWERHRRNESDERLALFCWLALAHAGTETT
jgi:asparagine synthase (glutamine-hydrolysing)